MPRQKLKSLEWKLSNREYIKNNDNGDQINSACVCETCGTTSYSENSANTLCLPCRDLEKVGLEHNIRKSEKTTWITKRNGTIKSQTTSTGLIVNLCNCCKEEENTCDCGWCDCCEECYEHEECICDTCELCEECCEHDCCECEWCDLCEEKFYFEDGCDGCRTCDCCEEQVNEANPCECYECNNCEETINEDNPCGCVVCEVCDKYECECIDCFSCGEQICADNHCECVVIP